MQHRLSLSFLLLVLVADARADFITGTVVDSQGAGVAGVDIDVDNLGSGGDPDVFNDGTDANGFFFTTVETSGTFRLRFKAPAPPATTHLVLVLEDVVVAGTKNLGTLVLPPGVALSGRAVTNTGDPVEDVNLDVLDAAGNDLWLNAAFGGVTDAEGQFLVAVPTGPIELRLDTTPVADPVLAPKVVPLAPTGTLNLGDVVLAPGFRLSATVLGSSGFPLANADTDTSDALTGVKLFTPADNTNTSGFVQVTVPPGTYDFTICPTPATLLVAKKVAGVVVSANTSLGSQTLAAGKLLSGTVTAAGSPVSGVDLDVANASTGVKVTLCNDNTNASGQYIVVVPTGTWSLDFDPPLALPLGGLTVSPVVVTAAKVVNASLPACPFGVSYGNGLAGTGGIVPTLGTTGGAPRLGNADFALQIGAALGGSRALLVVGLQPAAIPFHQGTLLVAVTGVPERGAGPFPVGMALPNTNPPPAPLPAGLQLLPLGGAQGAPGAGATSVPFAIPDEPLLVGASNYLQVLVRDPGAIDGWALSKGLEITYCE